jgi:hypothetical protein
MKVSFTIAALAAVVGTTTAFLQPSQLQLKLQHEHEANNGIDFGFLTAAQAPKYSSTSLRMVAIRSPFWHAAFDGKEKELDSEEFIVDRDFSVAA